MCFAVGDKLKVLDLFSGIGGFSLGLERTGGFETVAFCEIEEFPRKVLKKHWPEVHCHDDVTTLTKETLCAGYAQNALLNQLCRETGGSIRIAEDAITHIKKSFEKGTLKSIEKHTTKEPQSAEAALSAIMAGSVPVAERANMRFWQLITSITMAPKSARDTVLLHGRSLSSADYLTIIKFFVTTAIWQNPSMAPAHIKESMRIKAYEDVRTLTGDILRRDGISVDVITGGFPCQAFSSAARGRNNAPDLWPEMARVVAEVMPKFAIAENVKFDPIARAADHFTALGMQCDVVRLPANEIGAPTKRLRWWAVAHPYKNGEFPRALDAEARKLHEVFGSVWGAENYKAAICLSDGLPGGLGGTNAGSFGNAVVPQIPELIGRAILEAEND